VISRRRPRPSKVLQRRQIILDALGQVEGLRSDWVMLTAVHFGVSERTIDTR
jgi:hypothetical protein